MIVYALVFFKSILKFIRPSQESVFICQDCEEVEPKFLLSNLFSMIVSLFFAQTF